MGKDDERGYQAEIPEDALAEALQSVEKYGQGDSQTQAGAASGEGGQDDGETVVEVEVEPEPPGEAPAEPGEAGTEELVAQLRTDLDKARGEAAAAQEKMLRVAAEADNLRKRTIKERNDAIRYGQENLLRDILPVIDNLERSLAHLPPGGQNEALDALRQGVEMVLKQFLGVLDKHDVRPFDSVGQPFDPKRHEALSRQETDAAEPGTVLSEAHRGYLLHDRLLRPALVTVACEASGGDAEAAPGCAEAAGSGEAEAAEREETGETGGPDEPTDAQE
jgi:molecular chaperone GrpE